MSTKFKGKFFVFAKSFLRWLLPVIIFIAVTVLKLSTVLALVLVVLSKWRILSVKFRYWFLNIKINSVDLIVSFAIIFLLALPDSNLYQQLGLLAFYILWAIFLKFMTSKRGVLVQSLIAQVLSLYVVIYSPIYKTNPVLSLVLVWLIAYFTAWHFLNNLNFEVKKYQPVLINIWSLFCLQLAWVLFVWQVNFWIIPQLILLQVITFTALAILYILHEEGKLASLFKYQIMISLTVLTLAILLLADLSL